MSNFIVTGASGYLGRHVVHALVCNGHAVTAITRDASAQFEPEVETLTGDIFALDAGTWHRIAPGATVIHLAWRDGFHHASPAHMGDLSLHAGLVLSLAEAGMKRFVSIGSMHEVGPAEGLIGESVPCAPVNQYGIAKNALRLSAAELAVRIGFSNAWLRCFYIVGDDRKNHSVFTRLLERADAGDTSFPLTTGLAKFDFIHVTELGGLIAAAADSAHEGLLNVGSGQVRTLREQIEQFIAAEGLSIRPDFGAFPERAGITQGAWPDLTKLRAVLGQAN